jgi:hypothetical protein
LKESRHFIHLGTFCWNDWNIIFWTKSISHLKQLFVEWCLAIPIWQSCANLNNLSSIIASRLTDWVIPFDN